MDRCFYLTGQRLASLGDHASAGSSAVVDELTQSVGRTGGRPDARNGRRRPTPQAARPVAIRTARASTAPLQLGSGDSPNDAREERHSLLARVVFASRTPVPASR